MDDLRFPIGDFDPDTDIGPAARAGHIRDIEQLPVHLEAAISGLDDDQLDTPYRPGGWTVRQVVHHVADSHLNAYTRFKLAMTEEGPTIRPYDEKSWAELPDNSLPTSPSLEMIRGLHARFTELLEGMSDEDFDRTLVHPETGNWTLSAMLALYSWHSRHHTAHITSLREREGW